MLASYNISHKKTNSVQSAPKSLMSKTAKAQWNTIACLIFDGYYEDILIILIWSKVCPKIYMFSSVRTALA